MERQFAIFGLQLAELQSTIRSWGQQTHGNGATGLVPVSKDPVMEQRQAAAPPAETEARGLEELLMEFECEMPPRVSDKSEGGEL